MKPRVFVSSTFYDLKYVREDLANFIRSRDFEPIMFEDGDIGYDSGKPLDDSCYDAMRNSDMVVLIIGGQYGTNATSQEDNLSEFISITQKEFKTAYDSGIPIFAFVDGKVNAEFAIYKNNSENIEKNPKYITFNAAKDNRIFKFIDSIYKLGTIPLNDFNRISDIKDFLAKQWSDMFKKYLSMCKENQEIETIKSSVSKLESMIDKISVMMDAVGKNVLKESNEYDTVKNKQCAQQIYSLFKNNIKFMRTDPYKFNGTQNFIDSICKASELLNTYKLEEVSKDMKLQDLIVLKISSIFEQNGLMIKRWTGNFIINFMELNDYLQDEDIIIELRKLLDVKSFRELVES